MSKVNFDIFDLYKDVLWVWNPEQKHEKWLSTSIAFQISSNIFFILKHIGNNFNVSHLKSVTNVDSSSFMFVLYAINGD